MNGNNPRLSIGMPVFNGEKYIECALNSILDQTYKNFEIIISDNASTDRTQSICLDYKAQDNRIRYYCNEENLGAPANYNRVFCLSTGKYFKWAAHDDVLAPQYIEKCMNVLEHDPSIVLCHSKVGRINEDGDLVGNWDDWTLGNIDSHKPHERFRDMISNRNTGLTFMGIIRSENLIKTPLHGDYIGADLNLTAELSLMGRMHEIQEHLFFRRDHKLAYSNIYNTLARYDFNSSVRDYRRQLAWWGINEQSFLMGLPRWKRFYELLRSVNRAPLSFHDYLMCNKELITWLFRVKKSLAIDLVNEFQLWRFRLHYGNQIKKTKQSQD